MTDADTGILQVDIERILTRHLPVAEFLKAKVEKGNELNEFDLDFLDQMLNEAQKMLPVYNRHPDYQHMASMIMTLYEEIVAKALENETSREDEKPIPT